MTRRVRLDDARVRVVARVLYYVAILVAVAVVASYAGRVETPYVYQGF